MLFDKRPSVHENADSRTDGLFLRAFYQVLRSVGTRNSRSVHPRCFCGDESGNLYSLKRGVLGTRKDAYSLNQDCRIHNKQKRQETCNLNRTPIGRQVLRTGQGRAADTGKRGRMSDCLWWF